jgi:hypothetical protein
MNQVESKLTVFFEDPFWVGVFERNSEGKLEVCRVVFGAEPKENELHDFLLNKWRELQFSAAVPVDLPVRRHINPKRLQRMIKKEIQPVGIGTKAQQALKHQIELNKVEGKTRNRQELDSMNERLYIKHQQKQKEKHKGH